MRVFVEERHYFHYRLFHSYDIEVHTVCLLQFKVLAWIKNIGHAFIKENAGVGACFLEAENLQEKFTEFLVQSQVFHVPRYVEMNNAFGL